ncbi:MAG: hypothetical protein JXA60_12620 [Candidatus Coatesbacteria bacterium]|nr:hypothetical protein [Candidatus Coatesbacteria bacterium]
MEEILKNIYFLPSIGALIIISIILVYFALRSKINCILKNCLKNKEKDKAVTECELNKTNEIVNEKHKETNKHITNELLKMFNNFSDLSTNNYNGLKEIMQLMNDDIKKNIPRTNAKDGGEVSSIEQVSLLQIVEDENNNLLKRIRSELFEDDIAQIAEIDETGMQSLHLVKAEISSKISSLIHFMPDLAQSIIKGSASLYKFTFSQETLSMLKNKATELMISAGETKSIPSEETEKISTTSVSVSFAVGIWQMLAIITSQRYLSAINKKLASIQNGINSIEEWVNDEIKTRITGNYEQLKSLLEKIQEEKTSNSAKIVFYNQLEEIKKETYQIENQLIKRIGNNFSIFSSSREQKEALEEIYSNGFYPLYLTIFIRYTCLQVEYIITQDDLMFGYQFDALKKDFKTNLGRENIIENKVLEKINQSPKGWLEKTQQKVIYILTGNDKPLETDPEVEELTKNLEERKQRSLDLKNEIKAYLVSQSKPFEIFFKINENNEIEEFESEQENA